MRKTNECDYAGRQVLVLVLRASQGQHHNNIIMMQQLNNHDIAIAAAFELMPLLTCPAPEPRPVPPSVVPAGMPPLC